MKEKKQSKDWYIAATHYLTAGFIMPLFTGAIGTAIITLIGGDSVALAFIVIEATWLLGIWLGTMYSAKYVNKTYVIKDSDNVAKLATIYLGILAGGYQLYNLLKEISTASIMNILFFIGGIIVFYILSKKYIKNSGVQK